MKGKNKAKTASENPKRFECFLLAVPSLHQQLDYKTHMPESVVIVGGGLVGAITAVLMAPHVKHISVYELRSGKFTTLLLHTLTP